MPGKETPSGAIVSILGIASFLLGWAFLIGGIAFVGIFGNGIGFVFVIVGAIFLFVNWKTSQQQEETPPPPPPT
jgi:glucose dehydrogenase